MNRRKQHIVLFVVVLWTILIGFWVCQSANRAKQEQIQRVSYLFIQAVRQEEILMQPEQMFLGNPDDKFQQDSVTVETENGTTVYERNKEVDRLAEHQKREWIFQICIALKNPNRSFMLDSLFQEKLKEEEIIAQTAVSFSQGDSLMSCSNQTLCLSGTVLKPVMFGAENHPLQIKLQAYVLFPYSYLISQMPFIWWGLFFWVIPVIFLYLWQRHKKREEVVIVPHVMKVAEVEELMPGVFWNEEIGELRNKEHVVFLKKNRLHLFISLLRAPNHTLSYGELCREVLDRPLKEDESVAKNIEWNRSAKKALTQTVLRLKESLKDFPELSVRNEQNSGYRMDF